MQDHSFNPFERVSLEKASYLKHSSFNKVYGLKHHDDQHHHMVEFSEPIEVSDLRDK
jgi:hypothetical protein